jgi:hypothetical protein
MQTHEDSQHKFIAELRERAAKANTAAASVIAAGEKDEQELGSWKASNGVHCRHLPDDPQGILRLSIGGGEHLPVTMNYVVVRGKIGQCIELLEKALVALRECPE